MEILIVDEHSNVVSLGRSRRDDHQGGPGMALGLLEKGRCHQKRPSGENGFHTEDVCSIDGRGYIRVIDRLKDMIITGGEKRVSRRGGEGPSRPSGRKGILRHRGRPHPTWGEAVTAVLCPPGRRSHRSHGNWTNFLQREGGQDTRYRKTIYFHSRVYLEAPRERSWKRELREQFS